MQTKSNPDPRLYTQYYDRVFGYIMNRVRNRTDAEDITSDIFLKLYSKSDGFDIDRKGASSYIFRVTETALIDFWRKRRMPLLEIDDNISFSDDTDLDDLLPLLEKALSRLRERERDIIILRYYEELSFKDIAAKMSLTAVNARQILHVAIKKLRSELEIPEKGVQLDDDEIASVTGGLLSSYADCTRDYEKDTTTVLVKKGGC